jgi:hypothetical protein
MCLPGARPDGRSAELLGGDGRVPAVFMPFSPTMSAGQPLHPATFSPFPSLSLSSLELVRTSELQETATGRFSTPSSRTRFSREQEQERYREIFCSTKFHISNECSSSTDAFPLLISAVVTVHSGKSFWARKFTKETRQCARLLPSSLV